MKESLDKNDSGKEIMLRRGEGGGEKFNDIGAFLVAFMNYP